jgi:hypothetical protein
MKRLRSACGLTLLCGLALFAFAVAGASAGTTAFTCKEGVVTGTRFSDAHCTKTAAEGKFGHAETAPYTETSFTSTNAQTAAETTASTPLIIKGAPEGTETEIECTGEAMNGVLVGKQPGLEMTVTGSTTPSITACTVLKPSGKGCLVAGGKLEPKALSLTTAGLETQIRFAPVEGTTLLTFKFEKCFPSTLNKEYTLAGSWKATRSGTTLTTAEAATTTEATLTLNGANAGLGSAITPRAKKANGEEGETPLAFTAVANTTPPQFGTTGFTCKAGGVSTPLFSDAHCTQQSAGGGFGHVVIANGLQTAASFTNAATASETKAATPFKVKGTTSKGEVEFSCTTATGPALLENGEAAGSMSMKGLLILTATGCTTTKPKGCVLQGGKFETKELSFSTLGQPMGVQIEPTAGATFAEFVLEKCTTEIQNGTYAITGFWTVTPSGATWNSTHLASTEANSLHSGTGKLGIESSLTLKGRKLTEEFETPIAPTTG